MVRAVLDAKIDLVKCLLHQVDRGGPMSTLVRLGLLQIVPGAEHVLLERIRRASAQGARN